MSVTSVGGANSAYAYLQSLLPPSADGSAGMQSTDPVTQLLQAFYPNGASGPSGSADGATSGADPNSSIPPALPFSPDTMSALMSVQEQQPTANPFVTARSEALFGQMDANGDGQVSKSEFENIFGPNADMSKVDGLFNALDSNGDGSVSQDELTSAVQASHAHHHGHHHHVDSDQDAGGGLLQALMASGTQGATADIASNPDGSSTTTISYADGSKVSLTSPAGSSDAGPSDTGSASANSNNLLEQLIQLQAQYLSMSASQSFTTSQTLASI